MKYIQKFLFAVFTLIFRKDFQGFLEGHSSLERSQMENIDQLIIKPNLSYIKNFEDSFAAIVGDGECVSFAAGRMGFYSLLIQLKIGKGDEVMLTGFTCSVMANAVLKTGATIVYTDIDQDTLGTSPNSVKNKLTSKTRMIVAQHSFGIPCRIKEIASIAQKNNIFLLEDCAIALGSSVKDTVLGNFGDAAIFSTDHSKPLNTFTGGLLYSRNALLINEIRKFRNTCDDLPYEKLQAIWERIKVEIEICNKQNYYRYPMHEFCSALKRKLSGENAVTPYLDEDQNLNSSTTYAYPAKFPSFLAYLGILELENWVKTTNERKASLNDFINRVEARGFRKILPAAYFDSENVIIPLRIVWSQQGGEKFRKAISSFVDTEQTWFLAPIISTVTALSEFGYKSGDCPTAEQICPGMINIPVNLNDRASAKLFDKLAA